MNCYLHPSKSSETICGRCGKEICAECAEELKGKVLCPACREADYRAELNYCYRRRAAILKLVAAFIVAAAVMIVCLVVAAVYTEKFAILFLLTVPLIFVAIAIYKELQRKRYFRKISRLEKKIAGCRAAINGD